MSPQMIPWPNMKKPPHCFTTAMVVVQVGALSLGLCGCRDRPSGASSSETIARSGLKPESSTSPVASEPATAVQSESRPVVSRDRAVNDVGSGLGPEAGMNRRAPDPVGGSWVTCYGNYRPTSTPERDVTRLGILCGPSNGMKPVGTTTVGEASENPTEHELDVRQGDCFRIFAVADATVSDLAVVVRDPKGGPIASDHNNDRWPILNPDGPFCLVDAGKYSVEVRARQGRGKYAMQIWRLP
jgi:hypothetical protein